METQTWDALVESTKSAYAAELGGGTVPRPVIMPLVRGELVGLIRVRPTEPGEDALTGIDTTLRNLPDGYETQLSRVHLDEEDGTAGVTLSGGQ